MAHYAYINSENIVVEVITGRDENEVVDGISDWEAYYSSKREGLKALRASYNTYLGEHVNGGTPFRGNFPASGFTYDPDLDAFIPPKPFPSWSLNPATFNWDAPSPQPETGIWNWDEDIQDWVEFVWTESA